MQEQQTETPKRTSKSTTPALPLRRKRHSRKHEGPEHAKNEQLLAMDTKQNHVEGKRREEAKTEGVQNKETSQSRYGNIRMRDKQVMQ